MPVCDYSWDLNDAWVVCKQLGFVSVVDFTRNSQFGKVPTWFRMANVNCQGNESALSDCPHQKVEVRYCNYNYNGAGVQCSTEVRSK